MIWYLQCNQRCRCLCKEMTHQHYKTEVLLICLLVDDRSAKSFKCAPMFWSWLGTVFRRGLRMVVANQAIFFVGEPQQETIGRTLQTLRMSDSEVISAVSNLCVLSNTYMVGSLVLWLVRFEKLQHVSTDSSLFTDGRPQAIDLRFQITDHGTDLSRVRSLIGFLDFRSCPWYFLVGGTNL